MKTKNAQYSGKKRAQTAVEYLLLVSVFLVAILSTNVVGRFRKAFEGYFGTSTNKILQSEKMND